MRLSPEADDLPAALARGAARGHLLPSVPDDPAPGRALLGHATSRYKSCWATDTAIIHLGGRMSSSAVIESDQEAPSPVTDAGIVRPDGHEAAVSSTRGLVGYAGAGTVTSFCWTAINSTFWK